MQKRRLILFLSLMALPLGLLAQIKMHPHERGVKSVLKNVRIKSNHPAVKVGLPFWDDFSGTPEGNHPLDTFWLDNDKVTVSSGQAIHAPSLNVATFDGLTSEGIPYNPNPGDTQVFGYRDTLVSQPITLDSVILANRDSVYFSFFYQAGGNGEPPDPADFLRIEFKDKYNVWKTALVLTVDEAPDPTLFYDTLIQIKDSLYFHPNFQFRFISFGRKSGRYDSWHIDYVYLNEHRHANDFKFPDRTLSAPLGPIFGDYYAMPIKHYFNHPTVTGSSFFMRNLSVTTTLKFNTIITSIKSYENTDPVRHDVNLDTRTPIFPNNVTFPGFSLAEVVMQTLPDKDDVTLFDPLATSIDFQIKFFVDSADNRPATDDIPTDYDSLKYYPIDFRVNDTTYVKYTLDTMYAYDDGSAEYSAGLVRSGNEMAYKFENVYPGNDSIINRVDIYFPSFAGSANATSIDFFLMNDNNGGPGTILYEATIDINRTTDNIFTEYELAEGVVVDGDFYVGYREPTTGAVRVGLDKSNDTGGKMYYRANSFGTWNINDEVTGSFMIRPRFGPHENVQVGLPEEIPAVSIFPNPSRGEFYVQGQASDIQVLSVTGQPIPFQVEAMEDKQKVSASINSGGIYIIRYKSGNRLQTQKVLFIR